MHVHVTILHLMGINHERFTFRYSGRDYRPTSVFGMVVRDILAWATLSIVMAPKVEKSSWTP